MADTPVFRVNGREYPIPEDINLGEMCDAERYFGVEFGENASTGMRMAVALLWIAIKREDPSVSVDDVRELPMDVFSEVGDVDPPALPSDAADAEKNGSSGGDSPPIGGAQDAAPSLTGAPF